MADLVGDFWFDGPAKLIIIDTGVTDISVRDLYSRWEDWWLSGDHSKYLRAMRYVGGDPLPGSKELGLTYFLQSGWRIRPYEGNHTLTVNGNLYTEEGVSPYVSTLGAFNIMIISTVSSLVDSTIQQLPEIEYASFGGGVTICTACETSGTAFPAGTKETPVNNTQDAVAIANDRGFDTLFINGNITFGDGDNISGFTIIGQNAIRSQIVVLAAASASSVEFFECYLSGVLDGGSIVRESVIGAITYLNGFVYNCALANQTIYLGGNTNALFMQCYSAYPNMPPTIDMGGSGNTLAVRGFSGEMLIANKSGTDAVSINLTGGKITIDSTVTNGTIYVAGTGDVVDNSTGSAVVNTDGLLEPSNIVHKFLDTAISEHTDEGSIGQAFASTIYGGRIYIDADDGAAGQDYPLGLKDTPVSNVPDAIVLAGKFNANDLHFHHDFTVTTGTDIRHFTISSHAGHVLTFQSGVLCGMSKFHTVGLTGPVPGMNEYHSCNLENVSLLRGTSSACNFKGTIGLESATDNKFWVLDGTSDPTAQAIFDVGLAELRCPDWFGQAKVINKIGPGVVGFALISGSLAVDSSDTTGMIVVAGQGFCTGTSGGTTVNTVGLLNTITVAAAVRTNLATELAAVVMMLKTLKNKRRLSKTGSDWFLEVFDDDNTTVLMRKQCQDKDGNPITALIAGQLAQELRTSV